MHDMNECRWCVRVSIYAMTHISHLPTVMNHADGHKMLITSLYLHQFPTLIPSNMHKRINALKNMSQREQKPSTMNAEMSINTYKRQ